MVFGPGMSRWASARSGGLAGGGRHRLSTSIALALVFMAASPRGARELDYEGEETAIMAAVGSTKLDLLVEESGNPRGLGERLTEYAAMQALHLSCHGHNAWRREPNDNRSRCCCWRTWKARNFRPMPAN